jgi:cytochrome c oxidase assembly protein subunit 15
MNELPTKGKKAILIWLYTGMVMIIIMVAIGGITRLTHSGLSMVDWKPIMGSIPPLSQNEWVISFDKYKSFPEFQIVNYDMSLEEYKDIFFWEYFHRLWGRIMGMVFIIPFLFFWRKNYLPTPWFKRFVWIVIGGGLVGALGWFMVVSGLKNKPEVSHYRLAIHLVAAFSLLVYIYWQVLRIKYGEIQNTTRAIKATKWIIAFIYLQIIYGAFVAGLKAGLIHNTWPLMGGSIIHENTFSLSPFWENLVQHKDGVQFIHRTIAIIVAVLIDVFAVKNWKQISNNMTTSIKWSVIIIITQFTLGIYTLVLRVPVSLGVLHQLGALFLLLSAFRMHYFSKYT